MLALPSKPWKKVRIEALPDRQFRLGFVSEFADEAEFTETVDEDVRDILGSADVLVAADWPTRSVVIATPDLPGLKRNLLFACIMVELE
jgi:hypothetical protein